MKKLLPLLALVPMAAFANWTYIVKPDPFSTDAEYFANSNNNAFQYYCETATDPYKLSIVIPYNPQSDPFPATVTLRIDQDAVFTQPASCAVLFDPVTGDGTTRCILDDNFAFFDTYIGFMEAGSVLNWIVTKDGTFSDWSGSLSLIEFDTVSAMMPCFP